MAAQNAKNKDETRTPAAGQPGTESGGAGRMMEKARETASDVAHGASEAASAAGRKAEEAASRVAGGMQSLAGTIRERGPREGMLGEATSRVAHSLETGGRYLQEEGLSGMMDDLSGVIRRNPIPAVLIGIGIGFLLARTTTRS
jgi:hypothetical protein